MILGGGPNRIGQGIEFDYCCVHAALALREAGFETIMVNCNPETVSTDYDTSDRLYFEPLTFEDVMEIIDKEKPVGRDRAVRRPDAAEAVPRARSGRRADHRHDAGFDRHRGRPRALPAAGADARPEAAAELHRAHRRAGDRDVEDRRLPAGRAAVVRARRPRDGSRLQRRRPAHLHDRCGQGVERQPGAARPLPRSGDRSRRRCDLRRRGRLHRRHHGARRAGGRALRRLGLLAAAEQPERRNAGRPEGADAQAGARAQGRRADEHPVRDPERHRLHPRSESARLAHRAVRFQGDRRAAGEDGGARHDRQQAEGARPDDRARAEVLRGEGVGVPVREVPRGRSDPRPGNEIDRRSDGHRALVRRGVCEGAARFRRRCCRRAACA